MQKLNKTATGYVSQNEEADIVVTRLSYRDARSLGSSAGCRWKVESSFGDVRYFKTLRSAKNYINR